MNDNASDPPPSKGLGDAIEGRTARKLRAQQRGDRSLWFGIGMFGLIGWSVAIPTVIGAAAGAWIDSHHPSDRSWTLALLVAGLVLGCAQAWHWVSEESRKIQREEGKADHE